jgi:hypothetical protein
VEGNILNHPRVSSVLAKSFVYAELWVGRDQDSTDFFKGLGIGGELPQYVVVDAEGRILVHYKRPANVASMTPDDFAAFLEDGAKKAAP